jgi:hypothetical protein
MARWEVVLISIVAPSQLNVNVRFKHGRLRKIQQIRPSTSIELRHRFSVSLLATLHTSCIHGWWGNERKDGTDIQLWARML